MEIELKVSLESEQSLERLSEVLGARLGMHEQTNHYFDDVDASWASRGLSIRVRQTSSSDGDTHVLTVKSSGEERGGFFVRGEWERGLSVSEARSLLQDGEALQEAALALLPEPQRADLPRTAVRLAGTLKNVRRRQELSSDFVVELDTTTYPNGEVLYEAELEVSNPEQMTSAREQLKDCFEAAGLEWRLCSVSKRERLERVLRGESA